MCGLCVGTRIYLAFPRFLARESLTDRVIWTLLWGHRAVGRGSPCAQSGPPCVRQENKNSWVFIFFFSLRIASNSYHSSNSQSHRDIHSCFPSKTPVLIWVFFFFSLGIASKSYHSSNSQSHRDIHSCFPSIVFASRKFDFWGGCFKLRRNVTSGNVTSAPPSCAPPDFGCLLFFADDQWHRLPGLVEGPIAVESPVLKFHICLQ